jgi:hypothetical protein
MSNKDEALKQAIAWADFHGEAVFAGGGWAAVNSMNEWRAKCAAVLGQPEPVTPTIQQQEATLDEKRREHLLRRVNVLEVRSWGVEEKLVLDYNQIQRLTRISENLAERVKGLEQRNKNNE